ncbi:NERD domain-containing protein [Anaplasmataceae bacterium AB001_6]|nr:NERD domain-containing protein [Anaplasmataceae bacterium AB001_6]
MSEDFLWRLIFIVFLFALPFLLSLSFHKDINSSGEDKISEDKGISYLPASKKYYVAPIMKEYRLPITKKHYSYFDQGRLGEYLVFMKLEHLEEQGGRFLFNLYVPKANGKDTEIDMVFIHPKGFFVIESKNYSGWIFGNEKNQYWTQILPKGWRRDSHKTHFYNPIKQNALHIKYLKRLLPSNFPIWSIIVFSDKCTFKDVTVSSDKRYKVVQLDNVRSLIYQIIRETKKDIFSLSNINQMYDELFPFTEEMKIRCV